MEFRFKKLVLSATLGLVLSGCASDSQNASTFDEALYSGKPIESLTNQEPPKTEKEALERGDRALTSQNYDLALYEYIRSLSLRMQRIKLKRYIRLGVFMLLRVTLLLPRKLILSQSMKIPMV